MKKMFLLLMVLSVTVSLIFPLQAKGETNVQEKLLDYGIFEFSSQKKRYEIPGEPGRYAINYSKVQILEKTARIPMKKGIAFGIVWTITGLKQNTIEFMYSVEHPEMIMENGEKSTSVTEKLRRKVKDGSVTSTDGFVFNHDYELVPGKWKIIVKYKDIEISKTFEVYQN